MLMPKRMLLAASLLTGAGAPAPVQIIIRNATAAPMVCQILAAHWYTPLPAVTAAPGADATLAFAYDAQADVAVDDPARRLPLETLFCGRIGRAWQTRGMFDLRALAARAARAGLAHGVCRDDGETLACTEEE